MIAEIKMKLIKAYIALRKFFILMRMLFGKDYRLLLKKGKKIILLNTPTHGNLGDHAIALAEEKFLHDYFENIICEFSHDEYRHYKKYILRKIAPGDVILITGGGFIGTLWEDEEKVILDILHQCRCNRIVIMPQTAYFANNVNGETEKKHFATRVLNCKDATVFLRDKKSYAELSAMIFEEHLRLVPDIVTYLRYPSQSDRKKTVLLCLRKDIEKTLDDSKLNTVIAYLQNIGYSVVETDTVVKYSISKKRRWIEVQRKLDEFSKAELVITDRLHGMLFSTITSTPCIAFDNLSGKIYGTYEFLKYIPYIQYVGSGFIDSHTICKLVCQDFSSNEYSNTPLQEYYMQIAKVIKGE